MGEILLIVYAGKVTWLAPKRPWDKVMLHFQVPTIHILPGGLEGTPWTRERLAPYVVEEVLLVSLNIEGPVVAERAHVLAVTMVALLGEHPATVKHVPLVRFEVDTLERTVRTKVQGQI